MLAQPQWGTFGSPMKCIFSWTASSISRTGVFGEWKSPWIRTTIPTSRKSHRFDSLFLQKIHWDIFLTKWLRQRSIWTFCVNLWWHKIPWETVDTPSGLWKKVPVHIEQLKFFLSSTKISMIVPLLRIIASILKAASIGQIWLLVIFLWRYLKD